jgi:hypothetical protein
MDDLVIITVVQHEFEFPIYLWRTMPLKLFTLAYNKGRTDSSRPEPTKPTRSTTFTHPSYHR